ncbi:MAG: LysR family transcriptional regulator [Bosea sp. (in: a-proteobacteria)]|uniref:LysR family transcriptional regulator n=1 Tax=Bosea sp. (in: a-proteobacteria) TaxID=1871050 RepID=UPI00273440FD|nr:LysR family transcriptional regulator [Bosea sp. (in: a-proteobacteria)]MDP3601666.1 LysR family transcriptional regulator [Bosea sp. (in: a-proteobacteria)]
MKRSDLPSLDDLRAFETVARLGSVRKAAEALALTHGAVSRRVAKLSEDLGFDLLERDGRGIRPTAAGQALHQTVGRCFGEIGATIEGLRATLQQSGTLVVSCEPSVAMRWLIPRLPSFQAAQPDVAVHLSVGGGPVEFRRDRIDLAIRRLDFALPESWHVQRLFAEHVGPVMSPGLVAGFSAGHYLALGSKTRPDAWPNWLAAHPSARRPSEIRYLDHHFLVVEAAAAGLGVAMSPRILAVDDIERQRLVAPAGFDADGSHYGLIRTGGLPLTEQASAFCQWLKAQVGSFGR